MEGLSKKFYYKEPNGVGKNFYRIIDSWPKKLTGIKMEIYSH